ncbi:MAG: hypothetical protein ACI9BD_000876, partial [Candidatus Marinamargulisbacteria bacterium]
KKFDMRPKNDIAPPNYFKFSYTVARSPDASRNTPFIFWTKKSKHVGAMRRSS